MQKTKELPVTEELKLVIQEYASDRLEAHPTAHLIRTLRMFQADELSGLEVVLSNFKSGDYFILMKDGEVDWD